MTVELTGTVSLDERAVVASEVVGRVVWVSPHFANGGSLAADETFIRVDPAEFELHVESAETAVREAEAQVWIEKARAEEDARAFEREHPGVEASEAVRRLPFIAEAEARLMRRLPAGWWRRSTRARACSSACCPESAKGWLSRRPTLRTEES